MWIRFAEYFDRPLRPTPEEGFALLAGGRALPGRVPGSDPEGTLAARSTSSRRARPGAGCHRRDRVTPPHLDALRRAAAEDIEQVEIDYYSFGRGERTTPARSTRSRSSTRSGTGTSRRTATGGRRTVLPGRPGAGRCAPPASVRSPPRPTRAFPANRFHPCPDDPRVTLWLAPEAGWVVESYPTRGGRGRRRRLVGRPRGQRTGMARAPAAAAGRGAGARPAGAAGIAATAARRCWRSTAARTATVRRGRMVRCPPRRADRGTGARGRSREAPTAHHPRRRAHHRAPRRATRRFPAAPGDGGARKQRTCRARPGVDAAHRRRARHRAPHQDLPVPGVLHPVRVDGSRRSRWTTASSSTS